MTIADPRDIPGLMVWYSADNESNYYGNTAQITTTHDLSGNGNHGGVYNGAPRMKLTGGPGGGKWIDFTNLGSTPPGSIQLPTNLMSGITAAEMLITTRHILNDQKGFGVWGPGASDLWGFDNNLLYSGFGSTDRHSTGVSMDETWRRYRIRAKTHGSAGFTLWKDNVQGYNAGNTVAWVSAPRLGENAGGRWLYGMGLFVLYNRELTSTERADLETWAANNPNGGSVSTSVSIGMATESATARTISPVAGALTISIAQASMTASARTFTSRTPPVNPEDAEIHFDPMNYSYDFYDSDCVLTPR